MPTGITRRTIVMEDLTRSLRNSSREDATSVAFTVTRQRIVAKTKDKMTKRKAIRSKEGSNSNSEEDASIVV